MQIKILIIKLGYSETLDPEIGRVPSLGDVLRTTPMLWALKEKYPDSHITWLVTENAEPLLLENKLINRILLWDSFVPFQLMKEKYDVLINLEKISGVCALADMIDAWVKYGFRFDSNTGVYHGYEKGLNFISYIENKKSDSNKGYWQQILIEMLGIPWKQQKYIIGYRPKTQVRFDIGLNYEVGSKWPFKALPMDKWKELEMKLQRKGYSVSWQQGKNDLNDYMDWIHSCRLLVSNDSFGLHLALTFNKNIIGLFGPTNSEEVYFYNKHKVIQSPVKCSYKPCGSYKCLSGLHCMNQISMNAVVKSIIEIMPHPS